MLREVVASLVEAVTGHHQLEGEGAVGEAGEEDAVMVLHSCQRLVSRYPVAVTSVATPRISQMFALTVADNCFKELYVHHFLCYTLIKSSFALLMCCIMWL